MRKIKNIMICTLLCLVAAKSQAQSNLSGKWQRNSERSDAGRLSPNSIPISVEIILRDNTFIFSCLVKTATGELYPQSDTLKLDGTQKIIMRAKSKSKSTISAQWSTDNTHLIYKVASIDRDGTVLQSWKHEISITADGHLEIDIDLEVGETTYTMKEIFDKA